MFGSKNLGNATIKLRDNRKKQAAAIFAALSFTLYFCQNGATVVMSLSHSVAQNHRSKV
jgi:hypothetical protein